MKRVLVTGIAGFIGYSVAKKLAARGDFVIGCDDFNEYYPSQLKYDRATDLKGDGVETKRIDITHHKELEKIFESEKITHVVHMAAQPGVRYSVTNPHAYLKSNVDGFLEVLECCRHHQTKLVYASSSSVYGNHKKIPLSESDPVRTPASLYAATKASNELMAHAYHHLYGFPAIGLRFFTVYGPWGRPDMACFSFSKAIAEGKPIEVYNGGQMQRDFTFIDDIVSGVIAALDADIECDVFNLGKGECIELMDAIGYMEEYLEKKATIIYKPMQAGDVMTTCADISKSREVLGYNPQTSLSVGIPKFLDWMTEYLELPLAQIKE